MKDSSLIPRTGRSPGKGNGNPLQYSCLENSMDRGAWRPTVHGIAELDRMTNTFIFFCESMKSLSVVCGLRATRFLDAGLEGDEVLA